VYRFGRGSGQDTISNYDADALGTNADLVQLGAGLTSADLTFTRSGNSLLISVNGTNDQLEVTNYFYLEGASNYGLETIRFADGTSWDLATVKGNLSTAVAPPNLTVSGTAVGEPLNGGLGADRLYGYAGNDTLDGLAGEQHVAHAGGDRRREVDGADARQRRAGPAQVVEHLEVLQQGGLGVDRQCPHLAPVRGARHAALLVGKRCGVEELGDPLPTLDLHEQRTPALGSQREGQGRDGERDDPPALRRLDPGAHLSQS
jgi:Ca2+-binding RTX toxin-like protein